MYTFMSSLNELSALLSLLSLSLSFISTSCILPLFPATIQGRFQIRDLPVASIAGSEGGGVVNGSSGQGGQGHVSEEDEYAIPIVQDGKLVP